jgi:hypothetical protein
MLLLKMAAGLISLTAIAAVVAGNHIPWIAMEYFPFVILSLLIYRLFRYVVTIRDHFSLVWCDYIVSSRSK